MTSRDHRMNADEWNHQVLAEKMRQDAKELRKLGERLNLIERGLVDDGRSEHDTHKGSVTSREVRQCMVVAAKN